MDMVNDGKDIRLDTPQAVKEALASGKDLYNPQTGEFWWEYNYTGSIANTYVHLDDPNLLAVIDNPDFDLYEDIVGGLNYTGYITDSIETIIEDGEENAPLIDPRDEMFAQIASEDGWVIASPENVRKAVQSHMAEHGGEAPGKENGMDKTAEIAAWKENHIPIDRNGDDALVMHKMADGSREFIVAHGYDEETGHWGHGTYYDSLASAAADLEGRAISAPGMEVICPDFWYRDDIEFALEEAGLEVNDENVDAALEALDLDGEPILSNFHDRLAETGNEMIADAVNNIEPNGATAIPPSLVDRGISLKAMAESMRRASQALSANGGTDAPTARMSASLPSPQTSLRVSDDGCELRYIGYSMRDAQLRLTRTARCRRANGRKRPWSRPSNPIAMSSTCSSTPTCSRACTRMRCSSGSSTNRRGTTPPSSSTRRISTSSMRMRSAGHFDR